jgi:hypothetical protein
MVAHVKKMPANRVYGRRGVAYLDNRTDLAIGVRALIEGDVLAIRFPGFCDAKYCQSIADLVMAHPDRDHYEQAPDISKLGTPFFDAVVTPEKLQEYWTNASNWAEVVRACMMPSIAPTELLRLVLDERLPGGARLLRNAIGSAAFAGLYRAFERDGAHPHVDRLERDDDGSSFRFVPTCQLAANIYLQLPRSGGELEIWDFKPSVADYERMRIPNSYGLDRAALQLPTITLAPLPGELILFDAQNIHAVRGSSGRARVTASMFVIGMPDGSFATYS